MPRLHINDVEEMLAEHKEDTTVDDLNADLDYLDLDYLLDDPQENEDLWDEFEDANWPSYFDLYEFD